MGDLAYTLVETQLTQQRDLYENVHGLFGRGRMLL